MTQILRRHFMTTAGAALASFYGSRFVSGCSSDDARAVDPGGEPTGSADAGATGTGDAGSYEPLIVEAGEPWWLMGNYAPVDEEREVLDLTVEGALPPELDGVYIRNGPNPFHGQSTHWFLGDGMLHGVRLRDGGAEWYRNKYVETSVLGRPVDAPLAPFEGDHPANTALVSHAGKLLSLLETGYPYEVSPTDLSTVGVYNFEGALTGAMTAHPKLDPVTGEMLMFGYSFAPPFLTYHVVDPHGRLVRSEEIDVPEASMMHDFAMTENYVIFIDVPIVVDLSLLDTGFPMRWSDDHATRLGVMPRDGTNADVVWVEIDPGMIVHTLNAHEDGAGNVILEAARLPDLWRESSQNFNTSPQLWRFTVNVAAASVTANQLDDRIADFPQLNRTRLGRPYRYGYAMHFGEYQGEEALGGTTDIIKYDLERDSSTLISLSPGEHSDEVVFVPAEGGTAEDDGYLMGMMHDARDDSSYLAVYDASSAERIARVHIPVRVPAGFHGLWVPS